MIVTLNEIERTCQKALCGAGAPPGVDDEGGAAAAWLEARGVPALGGVVAAIDRWTDDPTASNLERTSAARVDAGGRSAVFTGPGLIGMAASGASPCLEIKDLTEARFLIPLVASLSNPERYFFITWTAGGLATGARTGPSGVTLLGDWSQETTGAPEAVVISALTSEGPDRHDDTLPLARRAADLETRYRDSLASGIAVEAVLWSKLVLYARRTLVPASAHSRALGAGSTASDNE